MKKRPSRIAQVLANLREALVSPEWRKWARKMQVIYRLPACGLSSFMTPIAVRMQYRRERNEVWRADEERLSRPSRSIGDCDDYAIRHIVLGAFLGGGAWKLEFIGKPEPHHVIATVNGFVRDGIPGTSRWGRRPLLSLAHRVFPVLPRDNQRVRLERTESERVGAAGVWEGHTGVGLPSAGGVLPGFGAGPTVSPASGD